MLIIKHLNPVRPPVRTFKDGAIKAVLIHRINLGTAPRDVLWAFEGGIPGAALVTGYRMPYHFLVEPSGEVTQCVSVSRVAPHAASWNSRSIGVGMMGDFRKNTPPVAQWRAGAMLAAMLRAPMGWDVLGHDEAKGASTDPHKQCPGAHWDMDAFRADVSGLMVETKDVDDFWRYVRL